MESVRFDAMTRALSRAGSRRRTVHAIGVALLGSVTAALGLDAATEASSRGKRRGDRKRPDEVHLSGKKNKKKKKKRKKKGKDGDKPEEGRDKPQEEPGTPGTCPAGTKECLGECIPAGECCGLTAPLCTDCHEAICEGGAWKCRSTCQHAESVCCDGQCYAPCENGCQISYDCRACNRPTGGKIYCPAQDRCVNTSCPPGEEFNEARCRCVPSCPSGVAAVCPPVPATDWPMYGGGTYPLPAGCCALTHFGDSPTHGEYCYLPNVIEPLWCNGAPTTDAVQN